MEEAPKSRTQKKNEDKKLQHLGEQLVALPLEMLEQFNVPEEFMEEVRIAKEITSHGARRRQIKHLGGILRTMNTAAMERLLADLKLRDVLKNSLHKTVETWRDEIKSGNMDLIEEVLARCPAAERNQLTHLAHNAHAEFVARKGVKASRMLFRYLKNVFEEAPGVP